MANVVNMTELMKHLTGNIYTEGDNEPLSSSETENLVEMISNGSKLCFDERYNGLYIMVDDDDTEYHLCDSRDKTAEILNLFGKVMHGFVYLNEFIFDSCFPREISWFWLEDVPYFLKKMTIPVLCDMHPDLTEGLDELVLTFSYDQELKPCKENKETQDEAKDSKYNVLGGMKTNEGEIPIYTLIKKVVFLTKSTPPEESEDMKVLKTRFPDSELVFNGDF